MSKPHISIRPMTAADLDRVLQIAAGLDSAPQWPRSAYLSALIQNQEESSPRRIALVATAGQPETAVGFAVASLLPPLAELESIAVAAECQRQGIARLLFRALARELARAQGMEIALELRASNRPALAFYQALGFTETGRRPRYYAAPVEDAVLMALPLSEPPKHPPTV